MEHSDNKKGLLVGRVGDKVVAHPLKTQRTRSEIRASLSLIREGDELAGVEDAFPGHAVVHYAAQRNRAPPPRLFVLVTKEFDRRDHVIADSDIRKNWVSSRPNWRATRILVVGVVVALPPAIHDDN